MHPTENLRAHVPQTWQCDMLYERARYIANNSGDVSDSNVSVSVYDGIFQLNITVSKLQYKLHHIE